MIKELLYVTAILLTGLVSSAQTQPGSFLMGGNIELNTAKNDTKIALTPNAGYFVANNFAVGVNLALDYSKLNEEKITTWGLGPFTRYYVGNLNFRPFAHADVTFKSNKNNITMVTSTYTQYFLGGGLAVFINRSIALETLMGYQHTSIKNKDSNGGFNLRIGFQVYLTKEKEDKEFDAE